MYLSHLIIKNHPILKDLELDFVNPNTNKPYSLVAFVGENGCGKTTLLNELYKYDESKNIIEKEYEPLAIPKHISHYLRQSSLARNAMKEIGKRIDGKDRYSASSLGEWSKIAKSTNPKEEKEKGYKMLKILDDPQVYQLYADGVLDQIACGAEISQLIDGKKPGYDISTFSSGQQEILLKLKDLRECFDITDSVLLDEPETSLHPRWQKEIINLIKLFVTDSNGNVPQIFVATHSEKVLESLLGNNDALIVRLFKENGVIKNERIDQMSLVLPNPSFAELDYVVFNIESFEYCSELHDLLEWKWDIKGDYGVDRHIRKSGYFSKTYYKEWINDKSGKITSFNIATYCRNYFHHPKDRTKPTEKELHLAINLLRNIILNLDKK